MRIRVSGLAHGALLLSLPIVSGCGRTSEAPAGRASGGMRSIPVRTAPVETRDVSYRVSALGSLEAEEIIQVTAEVEGMWGLCRCC